MQLLSVIGLKLNPVSKSGPRWTLLYGPSATGECTINICLSCDMSVSADHKRFRFIIFELIGIFEDHYLVQSTPLVLIWMATAWNTSYWYKCIKTIEIRISLYCVKLVNANGEYYIRILFNSSRGPLVGTSSWHIRRSGWPYHVTTE